MDVSFTDLVREIVRTEMGRSFQYSASEEEIKKNLERLNIHVNPKAKDP